MERKRKQALEVWKREQDFLMRLGRTKFATREYRRLYS